MKPNDAPPAPPQLKLPPDFFVCYLEADLAVHFLTGVMSQMLYVGRKEEAEFIKGIVAEIAKFRDQVRDKGAKAIVIAGPGDLPRG